MVRTSAACTIALILAASVHSEGRLGQDGTTVKSVTNSDVVEMTAAKLSDEVVVNAIQEAAVTTFDLSPATLISLKNAGVSDRVIQAMQSRSKTGVRGAARQPNQALPVGIAAESPVPEPCRIFITEEEPPSRSYVMIRKEVQVGKKFYGGHDDDLMRELAKQADKAGADAVIKFHEWRAPSKWSWAAAKAGGMAVKWTPEGQAVVSTLKGQCWNPDEQGDE